MITVREIQQAVCQRYGVTTLDLVSQRRSAKIALPRHVAMWMARYLTDCSIPNIGRMFGNRDHTTVIHAIKRVDKLVRTDRTQAAIIWALVETMGCAESVELRRSVVRAVA